MKHLTLAFVMLLTLAFAGCEKPPLTPVPAPAVVVAPNVPAVSAATATNASTAVTPVAKAKAPAKRAASALARAERAAYALAYKNAQAANQLLGRHAYLTSPTDKA